MQDTTSTRPWMGASKGCKNQRAQLVSCFEVGELGEVAPSKTSRFCKEGCHEDDVASWVQLGLSRSSSQS
jgi:hypothetical protein